jgi:hypothetical protein
MTCSLWPIGGMNGASSAPVSKQLYEEGISDISLATFHVFDRETRPLVIHVSAVTLFQVTAELETHGGQQFVGKSIFAARAKPLIESCRQYGRRNCLIDRSLNGPATLARVRHPPGELRQRRIFD